MHVQRQRSALVIATVAIIAAACGVANGAPGHAAAPTSKEPAACRALTPVRRAHFSSIPWTPGEFPTAESFDPWSPGSPFVVATLDDAGLHFSPAAIPAGVYNVCFVDRRTHRTHAGDVVLDFFFNGGPVLGGLSVEAGTIGADKLCPVLDTPGVTVGDKPAPDSATLSIAPGAGCPTTIS